MTMGVVGVAGVTSKRPTRWSPQVTHLPYQEDQGGVVPLPGPRLALFGISIVVKLP